MLYIMMCLSSCFVLRVLVFVVWFALFVRSLLLLCVVDMFMTIVLFMYVFAVVLLCYVFRCVEGDCLCVLRVACFFEKHMCRYCKLVCVL